MTQKDIEQLKEIGLYWDEDWWRDFVWEMKQQIGKFLGQMLTMHGYQNDVPMMTDILLKLFIDGTIKARGVDRKLDVERIKR